MALHGKKIFGSDNRTASLCVMSERPSPLFPPLILDERCLPNPSVLNKNNYQGWREQSIYSVLTEIAFSTNL